MSFNLLLNTVTSDGLILKLDPERERKRLIQILDKDSPEDF